MKHLKENWREKFFSSQALELKSKPSALETDIELCGQSSKDNTPSFMIYGKRFGNNMKLSLCSFKRHKSTTFKASFVL